MSITIVITSHRNPIGLEHIIKVAKNQTRKPDEIIVLYSDQEIEKPEYGIIYIQDENKNDWGHSKRALGLEKATKEYITFWNADDDYDLTFIEKMMTGNDVTYCGWNIRHPRFHLGSSTSGNFIVKTDIARKAGYTDRVYEADGLFIDRVSRETKDIHFIDEQLYYHNRTINIWK